MSGVEIGFIGIALMLVAVCIGVHIGVALIATAMICITILANPTLAMRRATAAANDSIRDHFTWNDFFSEFIKDYVQVF